MTVVDQPPPRGLHLLVFLWGIGWVAMLLTSALSRLIPIAIKPLVDGSLQPWQFALYGAWVIVMAYSEGWRGFHQRFSPRVVARAYYLGAHPKPLHVLLALPFCMSFFFTTRRQRIVSVVSTAAIIVLIIGVRQLPQPWRGIVDGGVVVGLSLGLLSILYFTARAVMGHIPPDAALPAAALENTAIQPTS